MGSSRRVLDALASRTRGKHVPVVRGTATIAGLFAVLLCAGIAGAAPALAVDDPSRPDARVTHGPSCRPGGVVIEVTGGTVPYAVTLATTRRPDGEDTAQVAPGAVAVLSTGDVGWGETIDTRLEYTALDDSGTRYVDELDGYSFTRPALEDCAAITPPTAAAEVPAAGDPPVVSVPAPGGGVAPMPTPGLPDAGGTPPLDTLEEPPAVTASALDVVAGEEVTLRGQGFGPGEQVTVRTADGEVLASVTAGPDGSVAADVRIPAGTAAGSATLELVGGDTTTTAEVGLQVAVAAAQVPVPGAGVPWPLLAAGVALLAAGAGVAAVSGRRGAHAGGSAPPGSA
jgi:hypothetical protein